MSERSKLTEAIMATLAFRGIESSHYNRIFEAVDALLDVGHGERAIKLVRAVAALLPTDVAERERDEAVARAKRLEGRLEEAWQASEDARGAAWGEAVLHRERLRRLLRPGLDRSEASDDTSRRGRA